MKSKQPSCYFNKFVLTNNCLHWHFVHYCLSYELGEVWRWCHFPRNSNAWLKMVFLFVKFEIWRCFDQYMYFLFIYEVLFYELVLSIQMTLISLKNLSEWGLACQSWKKSYSRLPSYLHVTISSLSRLSSSWKLKRNFTYKTLSLKMNFLATHFLSFPCS